MGFFSKLFGAKQEEKQPSGDHAVTVNFDYGSTDLDALFELEDQLEKAIDKACVGELDGNEIAADGSDGSLFMYGPDGDKLFNVVRPLLERSTAIKNAVAIVRYGSYEDDDAKSMEVPIKPKS